MGFVLSAFADEIDADLGVQFEHLVAEGISLIDLRSALGKNVMLLADSEILEVKRLAEAAGLGFNCVGSPINKVSVADGSAEEELAKLRRAGEIAGMLGINRIRIFSPEGDDWGVITVQFQRMRSECLRPLDPRISWQLLTLPTRFSTGFMR